MCKSGGECLKVCNSVSLGAVWGFCIEVSVQGACKGCVRVCKGGGECVRVGVGA